MNQDQKPKLIWQKLRKFITNNKPYEPQYNPKLELFSTQKIDNKLLIEINNVVIQQLIDEPPIINIEQLQQINNEQIDNTGQFYWPAEQIMTYYLIKNNQEFDYLVELGAGKSGLAAICMAATKSQFQSILITDGNAEAFKILNQNVEINRPLFHPNTNVRCEQLKWSNLVTQVQAKTLVILADCLFFEKYHDSLISTIKCLIREGGRAISVSPSRGGSLQRFIDKLDANNLKHQIEEFEDAEYLSKLSEMRLDSKFDEDKHLMKFLHIFN